MCCYPKQTKKWDSVNAIWMFAVNFLEELSDNVNLSSLEMHNKIHQVTGLFPCSPKLFTGLHIGRAWSVEAECFVISQFCAYWDFFFIYCFLHSCLQFQFPLLFYPRQFICFQIFIHLEILFVAKQFADCFQWALCSPVVVNEVILLVLVFSWSCHWGKWPICFRGLS